MEAYGILVRFSCKNNEQYESIGKFWDLMSLQHPKPDLVGVGCGWREDSLDYLIGRLD